MPAPSYPLFEFLADLADVHLVPYPLLYDHGWQMDFTSLRGALYRRAAGPCFSCIRTIPLVHSLSREAAELAEICASREMAIVADEVFLDYVAAQESAQTFAFHDRVLTFSLSGLSKVSLLPQMKLAWTVVSGPEALLSRAAVDRLEIMADTYLSPSTPVQLALPKLLALRRGLQAQLRKRISANLSVLDEAVRESKCLSRLEREGGWYAILRAPATGTDEDLAVALLEGCSVLVHPGHFFNFSQEGLLVVS